MKEVDFDWIIQYLDSEIARLKNASKIESPNAVYFDIECSPTASMAEFLSTLLKWIKTAIRVERDRIQGARDSVDATLYALMSNSSLKFDDGFKKMLDHARGNAATWSCKKPPTPQRKTYTSSEVKEAANRLEATRLKLKGRNAKSIIEKRIFSQQDADLEYAIEVLNRIERKN